MSYFKIISLDWDGTLNLDQQIDVPHEPDYPKHYENVKRWCEEDFQKRTKYQLQQNIVRLIQALIRSGYGILINTGRIYSESCASSDIRLQFTSSFSPEYRKKIIVLWRIYSNLNLQRSQESKLFRINQLQTQSSEVLVHVDDDFGMADVLKSTEATKDIKFISAGEIEKLWELVHPDAIQPHVEWPADNAELMLLAKILSHSKMDIGEFSKLPDASGGEFVRMFAILQAMHNYKATEYGDYLHGFEGLPNDTRLIKAFLDFDRKYVRLRNMILFSKPTDNITGIWESIADLGVYMLMVMNLMNKSGMELNHE